MICYRRIRKDCEDYRRGLVKNLLKNAVPVGDERIVEKKIMPEFFDEVIKGNKKIEIRKDEDSIKTGDVFNRRIYKYY